MNFRVGGTKPRKKPRKKIRKDQAACPLAGAEVLVAVEGPSPRRGEGKTMVVEPSAPPRKSPNREKLVSLAVQGQYLKRFKNKMRMKVDHLRSCILLR